MRFKVSLWTMVSCYRFLQLLRSGRITTSSYRELLIHFVSFTLSNVLNRLVQEEADLEGM